MSFSSTDSFEVDLLLDDDDMMDINPFWSSDEEDDNEDEKKKEEQKQEDKGLDSEEQRIRDAGPKRDSGIVLTDTKEDLENADQKSEDSDDSAIHESKLEQVEEDLKNLKTEDKLEEKPVLTRNLSEENKLYCIKDKDGKVVKEDDMSRAYSRQKSESKGNKTKNSTLKEVHFLRNKSFQFQSFLMFDKKG